MPVWSAAWVGPGPEFERAWELVMPVLHAWSRTGAEPNHAAGTWGPEAATRLLERHGHAWNGT